MYKFNAKVKKGTAIVTHKEMDNADFLFEMKEENGLITAYLTAKTDLRMQALELETEKAFAVDDLFYANGYQSWSTSREFNKYGLLKDITPLGKKLGKFATRCCTGSNNITSVLWYFWLYKYNINHNQFFLLFVGGVD